MAFWRAETIKERQDSDNPVVIDGNDSESIKASSYELRIGEYICLTDAGQKNAKEHVLDKGNGIYITPGQFAIISTEEVVDISNEMMAFISMKASKKMRGLVNVSGFHVDPGFKNHLKFGILNAGPTDILVTRGEPFFQIFFADLDGVTEKPYVNKTDIEPKINPQWKGALKGNTLSIFDVDRRVKFLELTRTVVITVLTLMIALGVTNFIPSLKKIDSVDSRVSEVDQRLLKLETLNGHDHEIMLINKELKSLQSQLSPDVNTEGLKPNEELIWPN